MAQTFGVSSLISKSMTEFNNTESLVFNTANRKYVGDFKNDTYATGGNVTIKIPGFPAVDRGLATTASEIQDLAVNYTLTDDDYYNVTRQINLTEIDYNIVGGSRAFTKNQMEAVVDNYARPAYLAMQSALEEQMAYNLKTNAFYSPIDRIAKLSGINNFSDVLKVDTMMGLLQMQKTRYLGMNYTDAASVSSSLQNSFNTALNTKISADSFVGGSADKGRLAGLDVVRSQQFLTHEAGPLAGRTDITVSSVGSDGLSVVLSVGGTSSGNLIKAGDRFAFPTINWLQPVSKRELSYCVTLVAAEDASGNGAGLVTLTLNYPILASGDHANVSALPAGGAAVECFPDYNLNYGYTESGISASPLLMPMIYGAENSTQRNDEIATPVNVYIQGSITAGTNIYRISMLCPMKAFTPHLVALPSSVAA